MAYIYDMTATWTDAGTTYNAIKMDVTDTASASGSLLMGLQVGGSSKFAVVKDGQVRGVDGSKTAPTYSFAGDTDTGMYQRVTNWLMFAAGGKEIAQISPSGTFAFGGSAISLAADGTDLSVAGGDLTLVRDAANTLALRRTTNAQAFNIYNTYTDASNYERGGFKWDGNILYVQNESAGTGSARDLRIRGAGSSHAFRFYASTLDLNNYGGTATLWRWDSNGDYSPADNTHSLGTTSRRVKNLFLGEFQEISEMTAPSAPAANKVRLYAQDNGAGKTQLMALFPSGAAQQIAIEP